MPISMPKDKHQLLRKKEVSAAPPRAVRVDPGRGPGYFTLRGSGVYVRPTPGPGPADTLEATQPRAP